MSKYALPSTEEMRQLQAADPTSVFQSNFVHLQTEQLLEEVTIAYEKFTPLNSTLFALKQCFDGLPEQQVTSACLNMNGIPVQNMLKEVALQFAPPTRLDVIGSHTLRHGIKISSNLTIDLAVQIPTKCFVPKDFLNYRYHDKRNLYLGVLASALQQIEEINSIRLTSFNQNAKKPVLQATLAKKIKGMTISLHIYPVIAEDCFQVSKLNPARSNLREDGSPTPFYNNSILEDMRMPSHLKSLHSVASQSATFVKACMLLKVWLRQRALQMNGFQASMILLHLVHTKKIHLTTSPDTMFKIWLNFIATLDISKPLVMPAEGDVVPTEAALQVFTSAFDVVFLDSSNRLNIFGNLSKSAMEEVQWLATQSYSWLQTGTLLDFQQTFIFQHSVWARYDEYITIPVPSSKAKAVSALQVDLDIAWPAYVTKLATEALGDRVARVAAIIFPPSNWSLNNRRNKPSTMTLGLSINPENATRIVDKGPDAEDKEAAAAFRSFWKEKAELRRFKDGSIVETVVWDDVKPHEIVCAIVDYIITANVSSISGITSSNSTLLEAETDSAAFTKHVPVMQKVWNSLASHLRSLDDVLPLKVKDVQPISAQFRYTSAQPPLAHPFASSSPVSVGSKYISTVVDPCVAVLQFESSSSWPTTYEAVQTAKLGFYVHLAHALEGIKNGGYTCQVFSRGVDVAVDGFVFRIIIHTERDRALSNTSPSTSTEFLSRQYGVPHATMVHALQFRHTCFAPTVRFVRSWLESQLCGSLLTLETTELIVASLFLQKDAPPHSMLSGFTRFLHLLANRPWTEEALIVDLQQSWGETEHREVQKRFDASATQPSTHPGFFVAASYEVMEHLSSWSRSRVHASDERIIVQRLVSLARATSTAWLNWLKHGGAPYGWQTCFAHAMDYDVVLHLETEALPSTKLHQSNKGSFALAYYKNMRQDASSLYVGFDPLDGIISNLKARLGDFALVFSSREVIAIRWKPNAFLPTRFRVMKATHYLPLDNDSGVAVPQIFSLLREVQEMTHGIVARMEIKS
ncbi:nucleolar protein 6 [Thraustotheca clavata]|uniref:Nucleolar protein 6 n=1 Tax=Thraustotheca clavata TaxID=74557 RepID=A0A1V9ZCZ7_9STRA|nr:nucleolar protein 6 [Thraustotheca clavata]